MTKKLTYTNKTVVILGEGFGFPDGMAATSRVKNIAKGLVDSGLRVTIYCIRGTEDFKEGKNTNPIGQLGREISYEYTGGSTIRSSNWLYRRWDDFYGMLITCLRLYQLKRKNALVAVIIYSRNPSVVNKIAWSCKRLKIVVLLELCEWPLATTTNKEKRRIKRDKQFCCRTVLQVDGVISISSYIEDQVKSIAQQQNINIPSVKIPILISDLSTSSLPSRNRMKGSDYMLYTGSLSYQDIAKIVIDVCAELKKRKIKLPVKITGGKKGQEQLLEYAKSNNVSEYIDFVGFVDERTLIQLQQNAVLLLAPLPDNLQSVSRFPTKLGHYLASGRPVVTTQVGEVSLYLEDGKNAFIAASCSPVALADKIEQVSLHPDLASSVGLSGAKLASEDFHYKTHGKRLIHFIDDLLTSKSKSTSRGAF